MPQPALKLCVPEPGRTWTGPQLASITPCMEKLTADERVQWALDFLPGPAIMTSSFGAQAAVMLHLMTRHRSDIPVILIDTGYLFAQTYQFIDQLDEQLNLNLKVFRADTSPAWQEARFGRLWEQGIEGIERYNQINKVDPMSKALNELGAGTWFSGLRRSQAVTRKDTRVVQAHGQVVKVHPLADWSDRDIHRYLKDHDLPYHPLWNEGYVSIGDRHTSQPITAEDSGEDGRFFGLVRECGLHEPARYEAR